MRRTTTLLALTALLASCANRPIANVERSVTFSMQSTFAVAPTAHGTVSISRENLSVTLDRVSLQTTLEATRAIHVNGFRVGLAFNSGDGRWAASHWSEIFPLNQDITPDKPLELKNVSRVISIHGVPSLQDRWLVLEAQINDAGLKATTYAHSSRTIFAMQKTEQGR
jgi:hypothetical protein